MCTAGTVSLLRFPLLIKSWTYDPVEPSGEVDVTLSLVLAPEQTALITQIPRLELVWSVCRYLCQKRAVKIMQYLGWFPFVFVYQIFISIPQFCWLIVVQRYNTDWIAVISHL